MGIFDFFNKKSTVEFSTSTTTLKVDGEEIDLTTPEGQAIKAELDKTMNSFSKQSDEIFQKVDDTFNSLNTLLDKAVRAAKKK